MKNCTDMLQTLSLHSSDENTASGVLGTLEQNQGQAEEDMQATSNDSDVLSRVPNENSGSEQHIMISYNWEDQPIVLKIKDGLQKLGYKVWMDVEKMHGSMVEAMAKAVEDSSVVLVCFSELYKNSANCKLEAEYAFNRRKPIIPLKMQHRYTPDGWLGALCCTKLYFDFSQEINFNNELQKLVREIGKTCKVAGDPDYNPGINLIADAEPVQQKTTDDLHLTREITKKDMDILSQHLGNRWKRLARKLDIPDGEIDIISHDHSVAGLWEIIHQMLNRWKNRESKKATSKALSEALREIGEADIAAML